MYWTAAVGSCLIWFEQLDPEHRPEAVRLRAKVATRRTYVLYEVAANQRKGFEVWWDVVTEDLQGAGMGFLVSPQGPGFWEDLMIGDDQVGNVELERGCSLSTVLQLEGVLVKSLFLERHKSWLVDE